MRQTYGNNARPCYCVEEAQGKRLRDGFRCEERIPTKCNSIDNLLSIVDVDY